MRRIRLDVQAPEKQRLVFDLDADEELLPLSEQIAQQLRGFEELYGVPSGYTGSEEILQYAQASLQQFQQPVANATKRPTATEELVPAFEFVSSASQSAAKNEPAAIRESLIRQSAVTSPNEPELIPAFEFVPQSPPLPSPSDDYLEREKARVLKEQADAAREQIQRILQRVAEDKRLAQQEEEVRYLERQQRKEELEDRKQDVQEKLLWRSQFLQRTSTEAGALAGSSNRRFVTDTVDRLAEVAGQTKYGRAIEAAVKTATVAINSFAEVVESFVARGRQLSVYSPELQQAGAVAELRSVLADLREAEEIGPAAARLTDAQSRLDVAFRELLLPIKTFVVERLAGMLEAIVSVMQYLQTSMEIVVKTAVNLGRVLAAAASFDWKGAYDAAVKIGEDIAEALKKKEEPEPELDALKRWLDLLDKIRQDLGAAGFAPAAPPPVVPMPFMPPPIVGGGR